MARFKNLVYALAAVFSLVGYSAAQVQAEVSWKSMTIIFTGEAGGGFDMYARLIARHLPRHVPGNPSITVRAMEGAGGRLGAEYIAHQVPKDGSVIAVLNPAALLAPVFGADAQTVRYRISDLAMLGSAESTSMVCIAHKKSLVQSFDEALSAGIVFGAAAPGSVSANYAQMIKQLTAARSNAKVRVVMGYPGMQSIYVALERGEVDAVCANVSNFTAQKPQWFSNDAQTLLVQSGEELPLVPNLLGGSYIGPEDALVARLIMTDLGMMRPIVAPQLGSSRLAVMRKAIEATLADPELKGEAKKMNLTLSPVSGLQVQTLLDGAANAPIAARERATKIVTYK